MTDIKIDPNAPSLDVALSASPTPPERFRQWCVGSHGHTLMKVDAGEWIRHADYEALSRQLDALKAEKERLEDWKESAMERLSAWHALGDALSRFAAMRLGEDIAEQLTQQIPARLEAAERERDTLRDAVREWKEAEDAARRGVGANRLTHAESRLRSLVPDPEKE